MSFAMTVLYIISYREKIIIKVHRPPTKKVNNGRNEAIDKASAIF